MRKLLTAGIGLLATFALLESAMAADKHAPRRERAAAPERARPQQQQQANWNGGQAGGSNGASSVNNSFVEPGSFNFADCFSNCAETPFEFNSRKTSYIGGFFLGYRWLMGKTPFGGTVFGIEGDINFKKGESSHVQSSITSWGLHETFTGSQKQGTDGSLRLRVGTLITPWTLVYVTGGLAVGSVSGSFSYAGCEFVTCSSGGTNVTGAGSWSQTRTGGTVGAGVESEFWTGIKGRVEYRYTDLGKYSQDVPLSHTGVCGPTVCGTNAHIDLRATNHRVMVGFGLDLWR